MTAVHLTHAAVERLADQLSERDRAILRDLARVRVLSGDQLTRLHFTDLSESTRDRTRRRVLARLVRLNVAATLDRTIGGVRAGSTGLVYALGVAGQRLVPLLAAEESTAPGKRARRPWTPSSLFLKHTLGVSELYVRLREHERTGILTLARFVVEHAAWMPTGVGGVIKPDASLLVQADDVEDSWVAEVDRAAESLPTLRHKLLSYVDFASTGQLGPDGVTPRVLVTVPPGNRLAAVQDLVAHLPEPATRLLRVVAHEEAAGYITDTLRE